MGNGEWGKEIAMPHSPFPTPYSPSCWQQSFDLAHDALDIFLVGERNHKKFVPFADADHAVGEKPDSIQQWIAAENQADRKAGNGRSRKSGADERSSRGDAERAEQRRADVFRQVALKLNATAFGLVKFAFREHFLLLFQVFVVFFSQLANPDDRERAVKEPVVGCARAQNRRSEIR